jgi:hypothetical protein
MDDELMKQAFNRAAEIIKAVPANLQQVAFSRALDELLGAGHSKRKAEKTPRKATKSTPTKAGIIKKSGFLPERRSGSRRPGPKAALEDLMSKDFWRQPRIIGDLQNHLRTNRGYTYKLGELSPALVRLLRESKIERKKNKENQYEYKPTKPVT